MSPEGSSPAGSSGAPPPPFLAAFNAALRERLNPLFRAAEVRVVDSLPRNASNKV